MANRHQNRMQLNFREKNMALKKVEVIFQRKRVVFLMRGLLEQSLYYFLFRRNTKQAERCLAGVHCSCYMTNIVLQKQKEQHKLDNTKFYNSQKTWCSEHTVTRRSHWLVYVSTLWRQCPSTHLLCRPFVVQHHWEVLQKRKVDPCSGNDGWIGWMGRNLPHWGARNSSIFFRFIGW